MNVLHDLFDLTGRVALITGGSRGLGLQIAEALGEFGARVVLAARKAEELAAAVAHLAGAGIEAVAIPADLRVPGAAAGLAESALAACGRIDILVNNAGATWGAAAEDHTPEQWRRVMDLNVDATFFLSQAVAKRWMIPHHGGRIVNIASITGLRAHVRQPGTVAYNTSKAAVMHMTRSLAAERGRFDITVNAIAPGWFPSRMTRATLAEFGDELSATAPLGRLGGPSDLKGVALLFASDAGAHVTGQVLAVDGGASIV
jgi:NAD(P)-dependent dehydrogenase (short-subunit alcohol dehydrogenase family)